MPSADDKIKQTAQRAKEGAAAQREHIKQAAGKAKAAADKQREKAEERISEVRQHGHPHS